MSIIDMCGLEKKKNSMFFESCMTEGAKRRTQDLNLQFSKVGQPPEESKQSENTICFQLMSAWHPHWHGKC